jgi:hypothetical protein
VADAGELEERAVREGLRGELAVGGRGDRIVLADEDQGWDVADDGRVLDGRGRRGTPEGADIEVLLRIVRPEDVPDLVAHAGVGGGDDLRRDEWDFLVAQDRVVEAEGDLRGTATCAAAAVISAVFPARST